MTQVKSASNARMDGWLVAADAVGRTLHEAPCRKQPFSTDDLHRVASSMARKAR
jgi:hypothetical protein